MKQQTPKEKAKQLVEQFYNAIDHSFDFEEATRIRSFPFRDAKRCALICVEELFKETPMYTGDLNPKWEFLVLVKKEIETL